ncbi:MAG: DNA recombination protein RmuC [Phycisphaerales bacterium]|nr:DNA recombination protein RmuC [Phycisphaerales bacterium]
MQLILLIVICVLLLFTIILVYIFGNKDSSSALPELQDKISALQINITTIEKNLKEDFKINREENATIAKNNREELNQSLKEFTREQQLNFDRLKSAQTELMQKTIEQLEKITKQVEDKLNKLNEQAKYENLLMRDTIKGFQEAFDKNVQSFNNLQREKFIQLEAKQNELVHGTEKKLESIRLTVEEKLEKTLSERLGQSFETVGKQLIEVQKGLGEMQTLASDVGGLKKVLSNVKMRGGIGEVQLAMLLDQILAPEQYEANVPTKENSNDLVEFAIKLPGNREDRHTPVWLPVDAKFPKDIYEQLQTAYDIGDATQIELAQKNLENTIKKMAKDIHDKYLDPPNTTDFGIMFLPFEGIYAEVVRKASLLDDLQRKYKIIVTGPTTFAAILNSLQMGFKTLAIEKRTSEVWRILGAVKHEFDQFGNLMTKAQGHIQKGLTELEDVMGKRTKAIQRQLRKVESLDAQNANLILPTITDSDELDESAG